MYCSVTGQLHSMLCSIKCYLDQPKWLWLAQAVQWLQNPLPKSHSSIILPRWVRENFNKSPASCFKASFSWIDILCVIINHPFRSCKISTLLPAATQRGFHCPFILWCHQSLWVEACLYHCAKWESLLSCEFPIDWSTSPIAELHVHWIPESHVVC